mmetsp:Transcript_39708/g.71168  ORF Transcript_39708/g.71168 Transcript_39708/m.71168 type:complete len:208 (-) Transcript_39708:296-919(-)
MSSVRCGNHRVSTALTWMTLPVTLSTVKSFPLEFRARTSASISVASAIRASCLACRTLRAAAVSISSRLYSSSGADAVDKVRSPGVWPPPARRPPAAFGGEGPANLARAAFSLSASSFSLSDRADGDLVEDRAFSSLLTAATALAVPSSTINGRRRVGTAPRAQLSATTEAGSSSGSQESSSSWVWSPASRPTKTNWIRSSMSLDTT